MRRKLGGLNTCTTKLRSGYHLCVIGMWGGEALKFVSLPVDDIAHVIMAGDETVTLPKTSTKRMRKAF